MNSFVMSRDLMRGQIGSYTNKILLVHIYIMVELKNAVKKPPVNKIPKWKSISSELKHKFVFL